MRASAHFDVSLDKIKPLHKTSIKVICHDKIWLLRVSHVIQCAHCSASSGS